jgi:hypothetical protein
MSMYEAFVPGFLRTMRAISAVLDKAAEHCRANGVPPAELLEARLAPDMFPLARQVQIMTDHAKGAAARLSGRDVPKYEDTEATFEELKARIAKTAAFVEGIPAGEIDGSEERDLTLNVGGKPRSFKGQGYLVHFALPNFYFHATTAYDILRHKGVEIGKRDFIGGL